MPLSFDGVDDAVDLAAGSLIPSTNGIPACTIMGWYFLRGAPNQNPIFGFSINGGGVPTGSSRCALDRDQPPGVLGAIDVVARAPDTTSFFRDDSGSGAVPTGVWIHLAIVIDVAGDEIRIFRNGVRTALFNPVGFAVSAFDATDSAAGAIFAECDLASLFSDGNAEDNRFYSRALTDDEILSIFSAGGTDGNAFGLENWWRLDELPPGTVSSIAKSIKDTASRQRDVDPFGAPVYTTGERRFRRRLA